jgi:uncharacterized protein (DUF433 family)
MKLTPTGTAHISLEERGVAWIDDTNTKVIEVVLDKLAFQWSPEAIHIQHPHLPLARIYAALAYYYDHKDAIDEQIRVEEEYARQLEAAARPTQLTREELLRRLHEERTVSEVAT